MCLYCYYCQLIIRFLFYFSSTFSLPFCLCVAYKYIIFAHWKTLFSIYLSTVLVAINFLISVYLVMFDFSLDFKYIFARCSYLVWQVFFLKYCLKKNSIYFLLAFKDSAKISVFSQIGRTFIVSPLSTVDYTVL